MDFRIGYRRPLRTATLLRKKRQRTRIWTGVIAAIAVAVTACSWEPGSTGAATTAPAAPTLHVALKTSAPVAASASRRIYPYSIVPGGVASREDIARRVTTDKVVASHYASFDVKKAHAVTVSKPRAVHVSYRKGDKVYWTAKKVMLAQGETLLTDGTHDIRGRCGNRISDTAMLPVAMNEPTAAELDESMNVAPEPADEGSLQNASFGLDDLMGGNPTSFQRFGSFNVPLDNPTSAPPARTAMPAAPAAPQSNAMGLGPSRYVTVLSNPTMALEPSTQVPGEVDPVATPAPAATVTPAAPAAAQPETPVFVSEPITPATPDLPGTPVAMPLPPITVDTPAGPVTPVTPDVPATPPVPVADPKPPVKVPVPEGEVPEPGTLWLAGIAFALMLVMTRKKAPAA